MNNLFLKKENIFKYSQPTSKCRHIFKKSKTIFQSFRIHVLHELMLGSHNEIDIYIYINFLIQRCDKIECGFKKMLYKDDPCMCHRMKITFLRFAHLLQYVSFLYELFICGSIVKWSLM